MEQIVDTFRDYGDVVLPLCDSELDVVTNAWGVDKRHISWADLTLDDEQSCCSQVIHITDMPMLQMMDEVAKHLVPERRMEQDVDMHVSKTVESTVIPRERGPAPHVVEEALKVVRFVLQVEERTLEVGTRSEEIADVFRCISEDRRKCTAMGIPQHPALDILESRLAAVSCL